MGTGRFQIGFTEMTFDPQRNKLKKLVRTRMAQTGEPYAEALRKVTEINNTIADGSTLYATDSKGGPGKWTLPDFASNGIRWERMKYQLNLSRSILFNSPHKTWNIVVPTESGGTNSDTLPVDTFPIAVANKVCHMAREEGYEVVDTSQPFNPSAYAAGRKKALVYLGSQEFNRHGGPYADQLARRLNRDQHSICIVVTPASSHDPLAPTKIAPEMMTLDLRNDSTSQDVEVIKGI